MTKVNRNFFERELNNINLAQIFDIEEFLDMQTGSRREFKKYITNRLEKYFEDKLPQDEGGEDLRTLIIEQQEPNGKFGDYAKMRMEVRGAEDETEYTNKQLSSLFKNILYDDTPITLATMQGEVNPNLISIINPFTQIGEQRIDVETIKRKQEYKKFNEEYPKATEKIIQGIEQFYQEVRTDVSDKKVKPIDVKDEIREQLGNQLKRAVRQRGSVYKYWKEQSELWKNFTDSVDEIEDVREQLKQEQKEYEESEKEQEYNKKPNKEQEKTKEKETKELRFKITGDLIRNAAILEKQGQYIREIKNEELDAISKTNNKEIEKDAFLMFLAIINRIGRSMEREGLKAFGTTKFYTQITEGRGSFQEQELGIDKKYKQYLNQITSMNKKIRKENVDIIAKIYAEKYMGNFIPQKTMQMKSMIRDYGKRLNLPENELEALVLASKDIISLGNYNGPTHFPIFYLQTQESENMTKLIQDTMEEIVQYIEEEKFRLPQESRTTTKVGERSKAEDREGKTQFTYDIRLRGRQLKIKENIDKSVDDFIRAFYDYYIRPSFDVENNLGMKFPYHNDRNTKVITMYVNNLSDEISTPKVYTELLRNLSRNRTIISKQQSKVILDFLKALEGRIDIEDLLDKGRKLIRTMKFFFKDNEEAKKQIVEDLAILVGSIWNKTQNVNVKRKVFGKYTIEDIIRQENTEIRNAGSLMTLLEIIEDNKDTVPNGEQITNLFNSLKKYEIEDKILEAHDTLRILKRKETYYGRNRLDNVEHLDWAITKVNEKYNMDIIANEIVKAVTEINSFSDIAKSIGITEEVVYFLKANFR